MRKTEHTAKDAAVFDRNITFKNIVIIIVLINGAFFINTQNHLLFHTALETFNTTIAFCITIIAFISRRVYGRNHFLLFGVAFLFIGITDFLHTLAYPGMGVFKGYDASNLSTQLFVAGRLIESSSLLIACLSYGRKIKTGLFSIFYLLVTTMLLLSIFYWRVFPACYYEGIGYTGFKTVCEYFTAMILAAGAIALLFRRKKLSEDVFPYLLFSISILIIAQISFTFYTDILDIAHIIGSILRLISYYLIYKALVETSLMEPYKIVNSMNKELEQNNKRLNEINGLLTIEINERQKAESALGESEKRYKNLMKFLPDAIFVIQKDKITFINYAALKLLGAKEKKELLGKPIKDIIHADFMETAKQRMEECKEKMGTAPLREVRLVRMDGTEIDVESTMAYMAVEGEDTYISAIRDITERKRAEMLQRDVDENRKLLEEAAKYDRLKNEFMANISHELRTPLNIIFSDIQLMEFYLKGNNISGYDENISKHFRIMRQNCYRLLRLVNNIIDISKMDSGFFTLQLKNCDIVSLVEDVITSAAGFAGNKGIEMVFDTDFEEFTIACDPEKIERVMLNLLSNAVKFTPAGGKILITLSERNDKIVVSVKDNGIGIPRDKLEVIFQRFVQIDRSLSRSNEGSGIGLSLVKSIIEAHGGSIFVKSEDSCGSEFIFELPESVLPSEDEGEPFRGFDYASNLEKIKIEFSDI